MGNGNCYQNTKNGVCPEDSQERDISSQLNCCQKTINYLCPEDSQERDISSQSIIEAKKTNESQLKNQNLYKYDYYSKKINLIKYNPINPSYKNNRLQKSKRYNIYNKEGKILILKSLSSISQTQLITRSDIKEEQIYYNLKDEYSAIKHIIKRENNNEFIPISYEIIPETIMNIMFQQGNKGICYLVAGINAFNEIPSIFDQLFIDKKYSENNKEYKLNVFINSKMEVISLDDKFLYQKLTNNKIMYEGSQTYKYELFLKFIVKLFAELSKSKAEFDTNEIQYSYNKLEKIEGGTASELYSCILGTSTLFYKASQGKNEYINIIEKYINIPGNILATANFRVVNGETSGHQYAIKNMFEYSGKNGEKQKFITLFNPWGYGVPDEEFFDFKKVQNESINYDYIYEFNNNYSKSWLIKIPLNLFSDWFPEIEVCIPKYGFHYKVFSDYIERNNYHFYCFYNDKKQNIEIELFLDELNNVRWLKNKYKEMNIEISLYKIEQDLNTIFIDKSLQSQSNFMVRKNAYIYRTLEVGNYFITIKCIYFEKNGYEYNLRIGGEIDYLKNMSSNIFENLKFQYSK